MDLNFTIKNVELDKINKLKLPCADCTFWTSTLGLSLFDDINLNTSLWQFVKNKIFELKNIRNKGNFLAFIIKNGGIVKAAFTNRKCVGILIAGKYYLFSRLKFFNFYPPDPESMFLSCLYVLPEYRNLGIAKKLLIELEKDLIKNKINSIESVCKRLSNESDIDDYAYSQTIPFKYLIKNGFYVKYNDAIYPLVRLDLSTIVKGYELLSLKAVLKKIEFEKPVKVPTERF